MSESHVPVPEYRPQLTAHYERSQEHDPAVAEIAALLTRGPVETLEHFEQVRKLEDKDTLRVNAEHMQGALRQETSVLRTRIDSSLETATAETRTKTEQLVEAIDSGDEELMKDLGLSFEYAWMNDVVATMLKGHPPVEIETIGPYAAAHANPETGELEIDLANIPPNEMAGILVAGVLRKTDPVAHNTRIVSLMDELTNPATGKEFTADEQDAYVAAMAEFYGQAGVLKPDDVPGKDFVILRESDLAGRVDELETKLSSSSRGFIEVNESGERYFKPKAELVEGLALHSRSRVKELKGKGILLRKADGTPTCQAMDAAGFLNPINEKFMHVVMLDKAMESQQDKTYALLKALGTVKQERYHNILFDSANLSPELVAYGVSKTIERHTATFIAGLDKYDEWEAFDPYEYTMRNYGETILEEDEQIVTAVVKGLQKLGIEAGSLESVADIGSGPNLYPSMLMAPFIKKGAKIDMLEYSPSNRDYVSKLVAGELPEKHAKIWQKFEDLMVARGGNVYENSEDKVLDAANVQSGNIFELPEQSYDLISSYFVAESIVDSNMPFREAIQSLSRAIKPDGALVIAHMVGSEGYYAGEGTHFPAVNLSVTDLEEAYRDAGLDFEIVPVGENAAEKAREGYHGMAVVIARPKNQLKSR